MQDDDSGKSRARLRHRWHGMRRRCFNPEDRDYNSYGGRGIKVDPSWLDFEAFHAWAISSGFRDDLTLERIDVDGDYEPGNCCWIPMVEQSRNRRCVVRIPAFGQQKTFREWSLDPRCRASLDSLRKRIRSGWDAETAISTPTLRMGQLVETRTVTEWAAREDAEAKPRTIRSRLQRGWTLEDAITTPHFKHSYRVSLEAFGETKTVPEWLGDPRCRATARRIRMRIHEGWTAEEAITTPVRPMRSPRRSADPTRAGRH